MCAGSLLAAGALLAGCGPAPAASTGAAAVFSADSSTVRVAPNVAYARRGWWWQHLWGRHYRALWATPVSAPVLQLGAAGLQAERAGGSFQTNTLHLRSPDGRRFVLRSVDKDLSKSLESATLESLIGPVLRDQTCAAPPYGAYVAARLARAAGVYHTNPRLVYLWPDAALGTFRAQFRPALYLLEENPAGDQSHAASFGRAGRVVGSSQMLTEVLHGPARLLPRAYLRARLLDLLVGDWSRRADQWRWATAQETPAALAAASARAAAPATPVAAGTSAVAATSAAPASAVAPAALAVFRPIPRDRDQAFFRFDDGWLTRGVSWLRPRYQTFNPVLVPADVAPLTVTARALDHTALALLPEAAYLAEADTLRRLLSDAVLTQALQAVPPEVRARMTRELLPALQARRDALPAVAARYYQVVQEQAVVTGTDAAERFELLGLGPGRVRLRVWALRAPRPDSLLGEQTYDVRRTTRLTVQGLGGNDQFTWRGRLAPGFAIWLCGGAGRNTFGPQGAADVRTGLTLVAGPADVVAAGPAVRRVSTNGPGTAADWVRTQYRLRLGKRTAE